MARAECHNEQDLLDLLAAGKWPSQCDEELRAHVRECPGCADLVLVAGALLEDGSALWSDVRVPASGAVWWRAQTRARRERAREAASPVTVAQIVGASAALLVLGVGLWAAAPWLVSGLAARLPSLPALELPGMALPSLALLEREDLTRWWWVAAAIAAWLIAAPVAVYLAVSED